MRFVRSDTFLCGWSIAFLQLGEQWVSRRSASGLRSAGCNVAMWVSCISGILRCGCPVSGSSRQQAAVAAMWVSCRVSRWLQCGCPVALVAAMWVSCSTATRCHSCSRLFYRHFYHRHSRMLMSGIQCVLTAQRHLDQSCLARGIALDPRHHAGMTELDGAALDFSALAFLALLSPSPSSCRSFAS